MTELDHQKAMLRQQIEINRAAVRRDWLAVNEQLEPARVLGWALALSQPIVAGAMHKVAEISSHSPKSWVRFAGSIVPGAWELASKFFGRKGP